MAFPDSVLGLMIVAAQRAADVISEVYARDFVPGTKPDGSPVTEADQRAEAVILEMLAPTGIPVLAEESAAAGRIPELGRRFFCVDPLDGTREFLKRNGEFTVNIALCENGRPTLGVVLAPVTGALYWGSRQGAFKRIGGSESLLRCLGRDPLRVVASRSHGHRALAALMKSMAIEADVSVGSSLKFCMLAEGTAELYPRFGPTSEWDTAAGQAVLEAAGGAVLTLDGESLAYGKSLDCFLNPHFAAAIDDALARRVIAEMQSALAMR